MEIDRYIDFLLAYNKFVNLVSKKSTRESVKSLIAESLLLEKYLTTPLIIDAGSGGGLLGIPMAITFPEKKIVLVEPVQKKVKFLKLALQELDLTNATVWGGAIQEYMQQKNDKQGSLISRGFPDMEILAEYVVKKSIKELVLITAPFKINKIKKTVANIRQSSYNVPSRDNLIIFKMEYVSRET